MATTVNLSSGARNGNAAAALPPTLPGLDVADAAYHLAHDYPGGVPALAQRMGMSQHTLAHKVDLHCTTHHLSLVEAVKMQGVARDARVLQAMGAALGYVCINAQPRTGGGFTLGQAVRLAREFADVLASVERAVDDGIVTPNEMQDCERQAAELMGAVNDVLGALRAMMPKHGQCGAQT